jgi:MinD superfamily P-loop ATPase
MIVSDVSTPDQPNPAHITEQQRRIITNSQDHFDVVILDTAPLLSTNDAIELMDLVDLVLVVGRVNSSTSDNAQRVRELLSRLDAPVAGVVMIGSDAATNDYYYYYSRSRAKELARAVPAQKAPTRAVKRLEKAEAKRAKKSKNGNGANGSHGEITMVEPEPRAAPAPDPFDA